MFGLLGYITIKTSVTRNSYDILPFAESQRSRDIGIDCDNRANKSLQYYLDNVNET